MLEKNEVFYFRTCKYIIHLIKGDKLTLIKWLKIR